jgi:hypothetical protein
MPINFFDPKAQTVTNKMQFGLCDDSLDAIHKPAYLDEADTAKWIAIVENEKGQNVIFVAIDNRLEFKKDDGTQEKICDALLSYDMTVIFVELKQRSEKGNKWVAEGDEQLRNTIAHFETTEDASRFIIKKAYIANRKRPSFRKGQMMRMDKFLIDTGYILRIENRIRLD